VDFLYPEDGGDTFLRNVGSHKISTRRHIPEDGILHSHRRENLKSQNALSLQFLLSVFSVSQQIATGKTANKL
jgi:hypothetical protein